MQMSLDYQYAHAPERKQMPRSNRHQASKCIFQENKPRPVHSIVISSPSEEVESSKEATAQPEIPNDRAAASNDSQEPSNVESLRLPQPPAILLEAGASHNNTTDTDRNSDAITEPTIEQRPCAVSQSNNTVNSQIKESQSHSHFVEPSQDTPQVVCSLVPSSALEAKSPTPPTNSLIASLSSVSTSSVPTPTPPTPPIPPTPPPPPSPPCLSTSVSLSSVSTTLESSLPENPESSNTQTFSRFSLHEELSTVVLRKADVSETGTQTDLESIAWIVSEYAWFALFVCLSVSYFFFLFFLSRHFFLLNAFLITLFVLGHGASLTSTMDPLFQALSSKLNEMRASIAGWHDCDDSSDDEGEFD